MTSALPLTTDIGKLSLAARIGEVAIRTAGLGQGITLPRCHHLGGRGVD